MDEAIGASGRQSRCASRWRMLCDESRAGAPIPGGRLHPRWRGEHGVSESSKNDRMGAAAPRSAGLAPARQAGFRLLRRLLTYHFLLVLAFLALLALFPKLPNYLPIGGVTDLATGADVRVSRIDDPRLAAEGSVPVPATAASETPDLDRLGYARRLAIALLGIWLLMLPVSWVHKGIYRSHAYDHSLDETTLILPGVVAAIVLVVQYSLALAFALAGIVAGVQFRRALQDTFDALFILVVIGTGIAAGVGALEVAAVMSVFFCYATVYVCCFGDGLESDHLADRKERKRQLKAEEADD